MSLQYFEEKKIFSSKFLFIFLSQYYVQKYCVCHGPYNEKVITNTDVTDKTYILIPNNVDKQ